MQWGKSESVCLSPKNQQEVRESQRQQFADQYNADMKRKSDPVANKVSMDNLLPKAETGDAEAQYMLGQCYLYSICEPLHDDLQRQYDHQAQQELDQQGQSSRTYKGLDLDAEYHKKAFYWLKKSADQNYLPALRTLAAVYMTPNRPYSPQDQKKACLLILKMIKAGDTSAYNLMASTPWNPETGKVTEQYAWEAVAHEAENSAKPFVPKALYTNMSDNDLDVAKKRAGEYIQAYLKSSRPVCSPRELPGK